MQDVIEQQITINADLARVWELVTEPGWWVPNDGQQASDRSAGGVTVRESERYGRFPVQVVELKPRTYAAFRWASQFPGEELTAGRTTLVEFFVEGGSGDGVKVKVRESGFAGLEAPEEVRRSGVESNTEGWQLELAELRKLSEAAAA